MTQQVENQDKKSWQIESTENSVTKNKRLEPRKILIVDDDADIVQASKFLIEHYSNYRCDSAYDGYQAIDAICEGQYDYLLIDINLPGISGISVLNALDKYLSQDPILGRSPRFAKKVPVLLISAGEKPEQSFDHLKFFDVREFIAKSDLSRRIAQNFAS